MSTQAHVFILGVAVTLVFVAGLTIASLALGRSVRVHRQLRELRMEHRESMSTLEMEKRQLERELARARSAAPTRPGPRHEDLPAVSRPTTGGAPNTQATAFRPDSPFFEQH